MCWSVEMTRRNYQLALDKVEKGDERWKEALQSMEDHFLKRSILPW
jgi:hypothetical protein